MPKPPSTWKGVERAHANMLGIERTHWALPDGRGRGLATESKTGTVGKYLPKKIFDWWHQATTNAGDDHEPVVIIHPKGKRFANDLCVIELRFFMELLDVLHPTEREDRDDGDSAGGSSTSDDGGTST